MLPDFNRLNTFYQVHRHGSIARAAASLYVTQSAISQNLKKLEEELKTPLFTRLHKKLMPTPAGERLASLITPFYSTLENNLSALNASENIPGGLLRVGAPEVFGSEILPPVMAAFHAKYAAVRFQLHLGPQSVIAGACRNGELDIALVDMFGNREEAAWTLLQEPLIDEPLIMAGSARYVKKNLPLPLTADKLAKCRFIAYQPQAPELLQWFGHHFNRTFSNPDIVCTVENVRAVISAIRHHMGLGIVPRYLVQNAIRRRELVHIKVRPDEVVSRISCIRLPGRNATITERMFLEMLKNRIKAA